MPFLPKLERASRLTLDVLDNIRRIPARKFELPTSSELAERLLPMEHRQQLEMLSVQMNRGERRIIDDIVGEKNTQHPHRFVVERADERTIIKFIDPEVTVGERTSLRPRVINLMSATLPEDGAQPSLTILRYGFHSDGAGKHSPDSLDLQEWLLDGIASGKPLKGDALTLFSLTLRDANLTFQARFTSDEDAQRFSLGKRGSRALEGKAYAQQAIMKRFATFAKQGLFIPSDKPHLLKK